MRVLNTSSFSAAFFRSGRVYFSERISILYFSCNRLFIIAAIAVVRLVNMSYYYERLLREAIGCQSAGYEVFVFRILQSDFFVSACTGMVPSNFISLSLVSKILQSLSLHLFFLSKCPGKPWLCYSDYEPSTQLLLS